MLWIHFGFAIHNLLAKVVPYVWDFKNCLFAWQNAYSLRFKLSHFFRDTLKAESKELKSLLIKVKEESEKVGLKLNIQKTKIMTSDPITSWQIDGARWAIVHRVAKSQTRLSH